MQNSNPANKYLYKSKELQDHTGYYDYGFRQLDPALGRWFVQDALAEKYRSTSPYAYVKNNPINAVDIAGDTRVVTPTKPLVGGDFNITNYGVEYIGNGQASILAGAVTTLNGGSWMSDAYNSVIGRFIVPDFLSFGVGFNGIAGGGGGTSIEFRWVTHGPKASWKPMITVTESIGGGFAIDGTLNIESANYIGNINNITRSMMQTSSPEGDFPTIWGTGGFTAGGKIAVTGYVTPDVGGSFIIGRELNLGAGLPAGPFPANRAVGVSNTWILYDFYK